MSVILECKVVPSSGKQEFVRDKAGTLKCFLKSAPENGKANNELVKLISSLLGVPTTQVMIVQGHTVRKKRLKIDLDITLNEVLIRCGIETQTSI